MSCTGALACLTHCHTDDSLSSGTFTHGIVGAGHVSDVDHETFVSIPIWSEPNVSTSGAETSIVSVDNDSGVVVRMSPSKALVITAYY